MNSKNPILFFLIFIVLVSIIFLLVRQIQKDQKEQGPYFIVKKQNQEIKYRCAPLCDKEIQKAIEFLKDGGGEIIFSQGEFVFSNTASKDCAILVFSNISIIGQGEETVLKLRKRTDSDFSLICTPKEGAQGITLKNFKLVGNSKEQLEFVHRGISLKNLSKSTIEKVIVEDFLKEGIYCFNCKENKFVGNLVRNNQSSGIYLSNSSQNELSENKIENNDFGIVLSFSSENKLINNEISLNFADGIYLEHSLANLILKNKISENGGDGPFDGIRLTDFSNSNLISENQISDSKGEGFLINILENCSQNTVKNNSLSGNVKFIQDLGKGNNID